MLRQARRFNSNTSVILAAQWHGQTKIGVELTPYWLVPQFKVETGQIHEVDSPFKEQIDIKYNELFRRFQEISPEAIESVQKWATDFPGLTEHKIRYFSQVYNFALNLKDKIEERYQEGDKVLTLGGDSSISMGTIAGALSWYGDDMTVIWLSSHAALCNFRTSHSLNAHSMALTILTKNFKPKMQALLNISKVPLDFDDILHVGLRKARDEELAVLKHQIGAKNISQNKDWLRDIDDILASKGDKSKIQICLDVGVCDPAEIPCVGSPELGGLKIDEVGSLLDMLKEKYDDRIIGMDLTEMNLSLPWASPDYKKLCVGSAQWYQAQQDTMKNSVSLVRKIFPEL